MIDERTKILLDVLRLLCEENRYVVISIDDVVSFLPEYKENPADLDRRLCKLSEGGFINLRFSEGSEYCLSVLKKTEETLECDKAINVDNLRFRRFIFPFSIFLASFLGAFLGAIIGG